MVQILLHIWVVILLASPFVGSIVLNRLRTKGNDIGKERAYLSVILGYALYTITLLTLYPWKELWFPKYPIHFYWPIGLVILITGLWGAVWVLIPQLIFNRHAEVRKIMIAKYESEAHIFPRSLKHQVMMSILAMVVGISEEMIFRGFFNNYIHEQIGFSIVISFIISNVIFGLGHYPQGWRETYRSSAFGVFMGYLFYLTGNLLLPIILHVLYDLKIVSMTQLVQRYEQRENRQP
jgi:hypothetical protein